jgi:hypothetical protein
VLPSISVKRKVTVPFGISGIPGIAGIAGIPGIAGISELLAVTSAGLGNGGCLSLKAERLRTHYLLMKPVPLSPV